MEFLVPLWEFYIATLWDFYITIHNEEFGFRTDYEIITKKDMKRIIKETRK